jgi:hypothetical protein
MSVQRKTLSPGVDRQIAMELFHLIERSCGHSELVDDIGAVMDTWGDRQTSEQVLKYLKAINDNGRIFRRVFASNLTKRD